MKTHLFFIHSFKNNLLVLANIVLGTGHNCPFEEKDNFLAT